MSFKKDETDFTGLTKQNSRYFYKYKMVVIIVVFVLYLMEEEIVDL